MLNFFRKRASMVRIVFGILLVLVCVSMVVTLIPGLTSMSTDATASETVAEVGSDKINSFDLRVAVQQMTQSNKVPQDMAWLYTQQVLDGMVLEKATLQQARRMGLRVSEQEVVDRLKMIPELFPGGTFVGPEQYEEIIYQRFGFGVPQFEQRFRDSVLTEKLRQFVTDSVAVTPEEVKAAFIADNEKLVLSYVFMEPSNFRNDIKPTDANLEVYFLQHKDQYHVPEKRTVKILMLENQKARQALSVTDAERKKYYQDNIDTYRQPERVQVSHILFRVTDKDPAKIEAAKKKAADLLKQLKSDANFADVAKKNSEDTGTAVNGGDLGWITRGQTVPEFEKSAFSLSPGTLSEPVQTDFGIHILKVQAHEQARLKPLEEVQAIIDSTLLDQKAQEVLGQRAEQAATDWRKAPANTEALATQYAATVLTPPALARDAVVPGLANAQALTEDIFILQKDEIGRPVALSTGYAIPQLLEISPARPAELADAKDQVRLDYIESQSNDRTFAKAQELMAALDKQDNKDLAAAAKSVGLTAKTSDPVTQNGTIPSLGSLQSLGARLKVMKPGETAGPVTISQGQAVLQLVSRQAPDESGLAVQSDLIRQHLLGMKQTLAYSIFQENLKKQMEASGDLKINEAALQRLATAPTQMP